MANKNSKGEWIAEILLSVGLTALMAWLLMLGVGIAHADWQPGINTMDYGTAFLLCVLISGISFVVKIKNEI